jgi:hypothetical protein
MVALAPACGGDHRAGQGAAGENTSSVRQALTTITSCGYISSPGSYVVGNDLSTSSGFCITLNSQGPVTLDCNHHRVFGSGGPSSDIDVQSANNFTITNCVLPSGISVTNSANGTVGPNDAIGESSSSRLGVINVNSSNHVTLTGNSIYGKYWGTYSSSNTIIGNTFSCSPLNLNYFIASAFGSSNVIQNNTINGVANPGGGVPQSGVGVDDGILIQDENADTIIGNTISNTYDAGIETSGVVGVSTFSGNNISKTVVGIGGWYWMGFWDNNVAGNTFDTVYGAFDFYRACGLRPRGWSGQFGGAGLTNPDTGVFFYGNNFDGNTFTDPQGCGSWDQIPFKNASGQFLNYDGTTCGGGESVADSFTLTGNTFSNNRLGTSCPLSLNLGEPADPGAAVDRGNNVCTNGGLADYPLGCTASSGPLNDVDVLASTQTGASSSCNGTATRASSGLAYSGTSAFGPDPNQDWRYALALIYGGLDITTGVVDCGQAARRTLVSNWSNAFQNGCANGASVCSDTTHTQAGDGTHAPLWHAFRLADDSPVAAIFASIIGLSPAPSAAADHGFGVSPYCNAINWDASSTNQSTDCQNGAARHSQLLGPGGVPDAVDPTHRAPPPNTWGTWPQDTTEMSAYDVMPTYMQDNDPIRRPCLGTTVDNRLRAGEEVCNLDGNLGLVLPVMDTSWVLGQSLQQYPTDACDGSFTPSKPPQVFNCPVSSSSILGTRTHDGQCPSGDSELAGQCQVPYDSATNTSACVNDPSQMPTIHVRPTVPLHGRVYNLFLTDGTVNNPGYAQYPNPGVAGATIDMAGAFGRIHEVETVFVQSGGSPLTGCQQVSATNQIGCLVQADPCSIGVAGDGARTWSSTPGSDAVRVSERYPTSVQYPLACSGSASCQH